MCDCSTIPEFVQANPDIAGPGVIFGFTLSSLLTFFAVIVGWFTDSIDDSNLNGADYLMVDHLRGMLRRPKILRDKSSQSHLDRKARRVKGLEGFVLAQSDLQLVTGTAILVAGFSNPCSTDMYHFNIVAALAWFSASTHLVTLQLLKDYLTKHTFVRNLKVTVMIILLVLLLVAQTLGYADVDLTCPAACSWAPLANIDPKDSLLIFETVLFWTFAYGTAVFRIYLVTNEVVAQNLIWVLHRLKPSLRNEAQKEPRSIDPRKDTVARSTTARTAIKGIDIHSVPSWRTTFKEPRSIVWLKNPVRGIGIFFSAQREIRQSFLGNIISLYFLNSLGVIGVVIARWRAFHLVTVSQNGVRAIENVPLVVKGNEAEMGFGQIVPLLLLALPILAVIEVYNEAYVEAHAETRARAHLGKDGAAGGNSESVTTFAANDLAPSTPARVDLSALSDEAFEPPKHTDTESGLRQVRTLSDVPASITISAGPPLVKSTTSPGVLMTDEQHPSDTSNSTKESLDLYTLPRFRSWLYLITFLKVAFYTLILLSFNNLIPVISYPLNAYYVAYSALYFLIANIVSSFSTTGAFSNDHPSTPGHLDIPSRNRYVGPGAVTNSELELKLMPSTFTQHFDILEVAAPWTSPAMLPAADTPGTPHLRDTHMQAPQSVVLYIKMYDLGLRRLSAFPELPRSINPATQLALMSKLLRLSLDEYLSSRRALSSLGARTGFATSASSSRLWRGLLLCGLQLLRE